MPGPHTEHSRYAFDETDPTQWRDLNADEDSASFEVERVGERTLVHRQLIPPGRHPFGEEFKLFDREHSEMDSSWTSSGDLPRREVGIVHKIGVGIAPAVLDHRTLNEDIEKVLANAYIHVEVNERPLVKGSLETLPIGFGAHSQVATNGLPAADAVPDRFPVLYTNDQMRFSGEIKFPTRRWLKEALEEFEEELAARREGEEGGDTESGEETESDCSDDEGLDPDLVCVTRSPVLVTFYMTGIFGRVSTES